MPAIKVEAWFFFKNAAFLLQPDLVYIMRCFENNNKVMRKY